MLYIYLVIAINYYTVHSLHGNVGMLLGAKVDEREPLDFFNPLDRSVCHEGFLDLCFSRHQHQVANIENLYLQGQR